GFVADGTLSLRGASQAVKLPFSLLIKGDGAEMNASLTLQRIDFGIGDTLPDGTLLGYVVKVEITLSAVRETARR
ncbi:MAG: YceI family protein, partial [Halocynthiibacter sp.]